MCFKQPTTRHFKFRTTLMTLHNYSDAMKLTRAYERDRGNKITWALEFGVGLKLKYFLNLEASEWKLRNSVD